MTMKLLVSIFVLQICAFTSTANAKDPKRYFASNLSDESKASIQLAVRELSEWASLDVQISRDFLGESISSETMYTEDLGVAAKKGRPPRILLVDSRLRLNPEQTGKLQKHEDGYGVQLEVRGKTVALFFIGFSSQEISSHIQRFQETYAATELKSSRMPASEAVAASGSTSSGSTIESYGSSLWRVFKGCGKNFVNTANSVILYPVFALNAAKVALVGGRKIDGSEYSRDAYAAIFRKEKRTYQSAFSQSWDQFWSNEARAAKSTIQAVANFEEVIAKGVEQYSSLGTEEKYAFNCALATGGGSGIAVKAVANVGLRTAAAAAQANPLISTPAVEAARARALARSSSGGGSSLSSGVQGLEVREVFHLSDAEIKKIYGEFDPRKVVKSKDVETPPVVPRTGKRYRAHLDVEDGHKVLVEFEILTPPTPTGYVTIRFENPLHRGQVTERPMRQSELELSPGFREVSIKPSPN